MNAGDRWGDGLADPGNIAMLHSMGWALIALLVLWGAFAVLHRIGRWRDRE